MSLLVRNARVIHPESDVHNQSVDVLIEKGNIQIFSPGAASGADEIIDEEGLIISPGFVDVFADYREPGFEQKETLESGMNAARAGGFTEVFIAPNLQPATTSRSAVRYILERAGGGVVQLHPLGAVSHQIEGKSLAEMLDMRGQGAIAFSDGWHPVQQAGLMLKALEYIKSFNGIIVQIPIDDSLSVGGLMHEGVVSTRLGMPGIPGLSETMIIHRDLELLRYTGSRLHLSGVSTKEGIEMIRNAKAEGLDVTCSVTPYHLIFTDEVLQSYDSLYKVFPTLKTEADRQALINGLKDGTVDCIASHHQPQEWDAKEKEFEYAGSGMNLQEITFHLLNDRLGQHIPLERLIDALAIRPRKIFGLPLSNFHDKNTNFTIFTTDQTWVLTSEMVQSRSKNNPFIGQQMKGKIMGIFNHSQIERNKQ